MTLKHKKILILTLLCLLFIFNISAVNALEGAADTSAPKLTNPLKNLITGPENIPGAIGVLIGSIFGIVGALALGMFVYGGLMWMLSGGSQEKVKKGRDILVWATVGIIVIFSSYIILNFILTALGG